MSKIIYLFHPETKELTEIYAAQESPLEPGEFIVPVLSTDISPPALGANQAAVFNGAGWDIAADHRGESYWIGKIRHEIDTLGVTPPVGSTPDEPPPSPEEIFAATVAEYEAAVQRHLDAGARAARYDNILSARSYAGYPNKYQAESITFIVWSAAVWDAATTTLNAVVAGAPIPPLNEFLASLPVRTPA